MLESRRGRRAPLLFFVPVLLFARAAWLPAAEAPAPPSWRRAFLEAESLLMAADSPGALRKLREGLLALAEAVAVTPAGAGSAGGGSAGLSPSWIAEAELALMRLDTLSWELGAGPLARPVLEKWTEAAAAAEPNIAALARLFAGHSAVALAEGALGDGVEAARRIWEPLGFLEAYQVAGPFENERGGGFETAYGPEKEAAEAAGAGKVYRPDPSGSYPGKVRPVSFRSLPVRPLAGLVDLAELFRPNEEALGYLLTHVESEAEQPAALRLGTDGAFRVWLNGALVASRDVRRPYGHDQDAIPVVLRKGWNDLLIKSSQEKGPWEVAARLTRPDGSPLPGWKESEPPSTATPGGAGVSLGAPAASRDAPAPSLGSRAVLRKLLETAGDGGAGLQGKELGPAAPTAATREAAGDSPDRLHYLLGAILLEVRAHDEREHPDRELIDRAISLCRGPVPSIYHYTRARTCEREVAIAAERDDNEWREGLAAALAAEPPSWQAGLELAEHALESFGNLSRAQGLVDRLLEARPELAAALHLRGEIEEKRDFPLARRRAVDAALKALGLEAGSVKGGGTIKGGRALPEVLDLEAVDEFADRLAEEGRLEEAEGLLRQALARNRHEPSIRAALVGLLQNRGRPAEALELLSDAAALEPFSSEARSRLATALEGLDRPEEALKQLREALAIAPEDHELLFAEGKLLALMGRREEALGEWDRALSIQPNYPELREYVEFARSERDSFSERYRRDVSAEVTRALAEPIGGGHPVRVLLELNAVRVNPDGTVKELRQYVARAMNDRGVRVLGRYALPYWAGEQRVEFKAARVHRPGGRVEEARLRVHGGSGEGDWQRAMVDLPPLAAGDVVEVQATIEDLRQSFFGDYFGRRESLRGEHPMAERVFILEAPAARKLHFHQRNLDAAPTVRRDEDRGTVIYTWSRKDVEPERPEPGMPPAEELDPLVDVSTFGSWDDFARWYWNLIRHQFELSPQVASKVEELTSGRAEEREKIRAIYDFVSADIRYNAWEFGVHGFKPYNAATIFQRRFGDCKDKATLLCTMLKAAGITAYPVLIDAVEVRGVEDLTIPLMNHFNHCIAYLPPSGERPGLFLDGTAERHAMQELPVMDRGAKVLVVREGAGEMRQVEWNRPEEVALEEEAQVDVQADGGARVRVRARARGEAAADLRSFFEIPGRRKTELEKIYGARFAGAQVEFEEFSDLKDRSRPVEFTAVLHARSFLAEAAGGGVLPVLDDLLESTRGFQGLDALDERRHDVLLGAPHRNFLRAVYLLPAGWRVRSLPARREISGRFGKLKLEVEAREEAGRPAVVLVRELETTAPRVARADYPEFRELAAAVARLRDEKIVIERAR